ncbi:MAG: NACHT domain-containing protein [Bacteroidales bacterium]|nr:NACHT domain-containing protein [Bacteroidales bacterium]
MSIEEVKSLFDLYGYEIMDETSAYIVFAVKHSLYPGVDIVLLQPMIEQDLLKLQDEYSSQRFAVRVCRHDELDSIEEFLFDWFFQVKLTNKNIGVRYKEYSKAVLKSYGVKDNSKPYSYVESPYTKEENVLETIRGQKNKLIESIYNDINQKGPTLIIVEAAAGYGKTSTAMELLKMYENEEHGIRPFYMELSKDRQAATFRYLLLSQMHREFNVLLDDNIVNHNIKNGRIPLIIDGFDELLSEDLDLGYVNKAKRRGETMLSTIADYLVNNAKIVLTTRKTAILSGQDFIDWYTKKLQRDNVRVVRYSLDQPQVNDWLQPWQLNKLPDELNYILNPVILGYLHYLSDEDFLEECASSKIINSYITKLLTREMERQDLTISVNDQKIVFKRLASAFAYDDILSDSRSSIKGTILLLSNDLISHHVSATKDSNSIVNTLANHAVLDRKGNNNIGFVNDFVLGVFLGLSLLDEDKEELKGYCRDMTKNFIDKVLLAMSLADESSRDMVWIQLNEICRNLKGGIKLQADLMLQRKSMSNYKDETFDGNTYYNVSLGSNDSVFENCHFANMVFIDSHINLHFFKDCEFINCRFNNTSIDTSSSNADFIQCVLNGENIPMYIPSQADKNQETAEVDEWAKMLSLYTLIGFSGRKMQLISRIREEYEDKKLFKKVFGQLVKEKYILTNGDKSHISDSGWEYLRRHRNNG